jgi:spermidine/putrescine transport system permease protein
MTLLGNQGVPRLLSGLGFDDIQLLNTPFAVTLGIVYNYLPLMVLPIYVSLERLDRSFLEASRDLGAGPIATLRQIVLPLSAPGILSGIVLVFIPVMGEYLIPILLGGGKTYFLGNALADLFLQSRNWPFGSALAAVFVAGMVVIVAVYLAVSNRLVRAGREASLI